MDFWLVQKFESPCVFAYSQEKCIEQDLDLCQCFINLVKAFDRVNHEMLWKVLGKVGCPSHFVALVWSLHRYMNAWVNFNSTIADPVSFVNGVKQGCVFAPQL